MKDNRKTALAEPLHRPNFAEDVAPIGNQNVLPIARVNRICDHDLYGTGKIAVQAGNKRCLYDAALKQDVRLSGGSVDVHIDRLLRCGSGRRRYSVSRWHLAFGRSWLLRGRRRRISDI